MKILRLAMRFLDWPMVVSKFSQDSSDSHIFLSSLSEIRDSVE